MPRVEWEILDSVIADRIRVREFGSPQTMITSGSMMPPHTQMGAMEYQQMWQRSVDGLREAYNRIVYKCAYCRRKYSADQEYCPSCGAVETE